MYKLDPAVFYYLDRQFTLCIVTTRLQEPFQLISVGTSQEFPCQRRSSSLPFWWYWTIGDSPDGQGVELRTAKSILKNGEPPETTLLDESLAHLSWVNGSPLFCFIQISLLRDPSGHRSLFNVPSFLRSGFP